MIELGSRELYQIQISEKYKRPTSQLFQEGYFNNFGFYWKLIFLLPYMDTVDTKLRVFQCKVLNNILFVNKIFFKLRNVESPLCSFCKAEDDTERISFIGAENCTFSFYSFIYLFIFMFIWGFFILSLIFLNS